MLLEKEGSETGRWAEKAKGTGETDGRGGGAGGGCDEERRGAGRKPA